MIRVKHYYNTLNGFGDIVCIAFAADLSNFWLLALIGDEEQQDSNDVSLEKPFPVLFDNLYCKNK
jgi:hypothetical protein